MEVLAPLVMDVARVWWWHHVYVNKEKPLSPGTPRAAPVMATSAAPFCKACCNTEKICKTERRGAVLLGQEGARTQEEAPASGTTGDVAESEAEPASFAMVKTLP